jgi:hypothetical protein
MKKTKRFGLALIVLTLFLAGAQGCASTSPVVTAKPAEYIQLQSANVPSNNKNAPCLEHAAAFDRGYYGTILRIYLEATDPKGEMLQIATRARQAGYTVYPTDFIMLEPQYREHFKGYIQWNTGDSRAARLPEWTQLTINVSVMDRSGKMSNAFEFPFTFETGTGEPPPPPSPFQGELPRLGYIRIHLVNPEEMDRDHGHDLLH